MATDKRKCSCCGRSPLVIIRGALVCLRCDYAGDWPGGFGSATDD